ncbi:hypothetical protein BGZ60DRAFT_461675 [Tricladium varicosporioides]|nr:hypothetical protein BGZ60DRAFT_461675 [Hymenoscyphus varicosporioides]
MSPNIKEVIFPKSGKYTPLQDHTQIHSRPGDEDPEDLPFTPHSEKPIFKRITYFLIVAILSCLAAVGVVDLLYRIANFNSEAPYTAPSCYCGNSAEQARSLGCEYVPVASSWLPPHCRDEFLEKEFDRIGPNPDHSWTYYADYARTTVLDPKLIPEFAGSSTRFYNEWEWHVMHCMFYWRKLHRAQFSGITVDPRFNTDGHISHCTRLILSRNFTSTTVSGVGLGRDHLTKEELQSPVNWDDVRDGYGNHPPPGYLNDINSGM